MWEHFIALLMSYLPGILYEWWIFVLNNFYDNISNWILYYYAFKCESLFFVWMHVEYL